MSGDFQEITVYLPKTDESSPRLLAEELIASLPTGRAAIGTDLLTGAVEVRFYYDPALLACIKEWFAVRSVLHDIRLL